jgi:NAD(P)-dependent dehydrogenase (short-subunit alcohol dehydrogenase family)
MSVVVITGCSSGIGLASAVRFAREGWTVVATMRDLSRSKPLRDALTKADVRADFRRIDVTSDESVGATMATILADHGVVDVVIGNAGIGSDGTTEELSVEEFRTLFETNVLGNVRLLHAVLPSWRARSRGRFIAVGSVCGAIGQPFQDAYCASKFAVEGMLESLRPVVAPHGIDISVIEPGLVKGQFAAKYASLVRPDDSPYARARAALQAVFDRAAATAETNDEVASLLWEVATVDRPALRYQGSEMVAKMIGLKLKDLTGERLLNMTSGWIS